MTALLRLASARIYARTPVSENFEENKQIILKKRKKKENIFEKEKVKWKNR
jgi:hypothetical protein